MQTYNAGSEGTGSADTTLLHYQPYRQCNYLSEGCERWSSGFEPVTSGLGVSPKGSMKLCVK